MKALARPLVADRRRGGGLIKILRQLHVQILIALVLGTALGALLPSTTRALHTDEVRDWPALCSALANAKAQTAPSPGKRVWELLDDDAKDVAGRAAEGGGLNSAGKAELAWALDRVLGERAFYQPQAFAHVALPGEAARLLTRGVKNLSDKDARRLNYLLLEASLPGAMAPRRSWDATGLGFLGRIFILLLKMVIAPLVLSSIVCGVASLGDVRHLGPMGAKTLVYYVCTTFIAVVIGLVLVNVIRPGVARSDAGRRAFEQKKQEAAQQAAREPETVGSFLRKQIDKTLVNPFEALASGNVLAIIVFALLLGATLTTLGEQARPLVAFFNSLNAAMMRIVDLVLRVAPIGVFALMATFMADLGWEGLKKLVVYMLTVMAGLAIHGLIVLPAVLYLLARRSPLAFMGQMRDALMIAFSTDSSSATLPVTMECAEQNAGVPRRITGFVLPLGATVNMDGTALYEAVAAMFIAQVYGVEMGLAQQVLIFLTATLAAVGAAGIPSAGTVTMAMVLTAVGLPLEGIGIILGVDRILDMCRTTVNVWGDAVGAAVVGRYDLPNARSETRSDSPHGAAP